MTQKTFDEHDMITKRTSNNDSTVDLYIDAFILLRPYRIDIKYPVDVLLQMKNLIGQAIQEKISDQQLASELGHLTMEWSRDWRWIAHHITLDSFNYRRSEEIQKRSGTDALVYKEIFERPCFAAKKLYLKDPEAEYNTLPNLFKLSELLSNGNNLNPEFFFKEQIAELKPVVGVSIYGFNKEAEQLYWDNSILSELPNGYEWDENKKTFEIKEQVKIVGRKPIKWKVRFDNGHDKEFEV